MSVSTRRSSVSRIIRSIASRAALIGRDFAEAAIALQVFIELLPLIHRRLPEPVRLINICDHQKISHMAQVLVGLQQYREAARRIP